MRGMILNVFIVLCFYLCLNRIILQLKTYKYYTKTTLSSNFLFQLDQSSVSVIFV